MGSKGVTSQTPIIPPELSSLYTQTAGNIMQGQNVLPLFGGTGVAPGAPARAPVGNPKLPGPELPQLPDQNQRRVL